MRALAENETPPTGAEVKEVDMSKFIYDNGFNKRFYLCDCCGSKKLIQNKKGGFQPPDYKCLDCDKIVISPSWESVD